MLFFYFLFISLEASQSLRQLYTSHSLLACLSLPSNFLLLYLPHTASASLLISCLNLISALKLFFFSCCSSTRLFASFFIGCAGFIAAFNFLSGSFLRFIEMFRKKILRLPKYQFMKRGQIKLNVFENLKTITEVILCLVRPCEYKLSLTVDSA